MLAYETSDLCPPSLSPLPLPLSSLTSGVGDLLERATAVEGSWAWMCCGAFALAFFRSSSVFFCSCCCDNCGFFGGAIGGGGGGAIGGCDAAAMAAASLFLAAASSLDGRPGPFLPKKL